MRLRFLVHQASLYVRIGSVQSASECGLHLEEFMCTHTFPRDGHPCLLHLDRVRTLHWTSVVYMACSLNDARRYVIFGLVLMSKNVSIQNLSYTEIKINRPCFQVKVKKVCMVQMSASEQRGKMISLALFLGQACP